ncbi:MAG: 50S ribosomal protein L10 [Planctomycetaceae bacterium]|nr:50S ribosomal protein L10 [Planctomycetaceae bacterium]
MSRQIKSLLIDDIQSRVGNAADFLVVDCSRLDAVSANRWRNELRKSSISALTVKNSIAKNALGRLGVTGLDGLLTGASTLVWGGDDVVALSKEITRWAKQLAGLQIKGATIEGQALDAAGVDALSKSPGRRELIGQIAGLLLSPGAMLAGALQGPGGMLAGQLKKISGEED